MRDTPIHVGAPLRSFADAIDRFPISIAELSRAMGVVRPTVAAWHRRDFIPTDYWTALCDVAQAEGIGEINKPALLRLIEQRGREKLKQRQQRRR